MEPYPHRPRHSAPRDRAGVPCAHGLGRPEDPDRRIAEDARVATWKLRRDPLGKVLEPALVIIRPVSRAEEAAAGPVLLFENDWFATLRRNDVLRFRDTRGKKRELVVRQVASGEVIAGILKRAYVVADTRLTHLRRARVLREGHVRIGGISRAFIALSVGDVLVLTGREIAGEARASMPAGAS